MTAVPYGALATQKQRHVAEAVYSFANAGEDGENTTNYTPPTRHSPHHHPHTHPPYPPDPTSPQLHGPPPPTQHPPPRETRPAQAAFDVHSSRHAKGCQAHVHRASKAWPQKYFGCLGKSAGPRSNARSRRQARRPTPLRNPDQTQARGRTHNTVAVGGVMNLRRPKRLWGVIHPLLADLAVVGPEQERPRSRACSSFSSSDLLTAEVVDRQHTTRTAWRNSIV
jgi:hypothetical protein